MYGSAVLLTCDLYTEYLAYKLRRDLHVPESAYVVCVSYQISVLVLADPVHLYAVLAHLCECSCAVRLRIGLRAKVQEIGCLLQ